MTGETPFCAGRTGKTVFADPEAGCNDAIDPPAGCALADNMDREEPAGFPLRSRTTVLSPLALVPVETGCGPLAAAANGKPLEAC